MSNNNLSSIDTLPVELFHRIFDHLDVETIFFSVRIVSRLFRSIVNTYNRYILNMKSISKSHFYILCRLINPENVISLILSNNVEISNQIDMFISLVNLQKFTRLHSLILLNIDDDLLNFILKIINRNSLKEFTLNTESYDDKSAKTTMNLLSSTLRKLEFNVKNGNFSGIFQSINCSIQYLTITSFVDITDFSSILKCCPHLHTLNIQTIFSGKIIKNSTSNYFPQLKSLTINEFDVNIDELEPFLLMTPSLVYLKVDGGKKMTDGKRWEQFIVANLSQLIKFEFYFINYMLTEPMRKDLELIFMSFQTSFWVEYKKWFVTCKYEYTDLHGWTIRVYSIPICKSYMCYVPELKNSSLSTYHMMIDKDVSLMNNITSLSLTMNKSLDNDIQEKYTTTNHPLFPKVTEIRIDFDEDWSGVLLQTLSIFIDISRIVRMKLSSMYDDEYNPDLWTNISDLIKQAHNLSLLIIQGNCHKENTQQTKENLYSNLPCHLKHLQIPINNLNQLEIILRQCTNIATIRFCIEDKKFSKKIIKWFANNTINSTYENSQGLISIWIGTRKISSTTTNVRNNKRIKLTHNKY